MIDQREEHTAIVAEGLDALREWAEGTGQADELEAIERNRIGPIDYRLAEEQFLHASEWYDAMGDDLRSSVYSNLASMAGALIHH